MIAALVILGCVVGGATVGWLHPDPVMSAAGACAGAVVAAIVLG